ncbi:hypothetical protein GUJ93_ZPchr0004g38605 [Zizania palustris]|uniref:AAA+ ATPase domain-containing protein n=1 Tax=Zizania palustris TaxID=103762 RepID=A0A8J5S5W9_ZIZPA|nr:hypothetical protein GUJ93_ZPchr0004g38605 [Zizania palustris]
MADLRGHSRGHSVDVPLSRTLVQLKRVRSLRDPTTNSLSKYASTSDNMIWETASSNGVMIDLSRSATHHQLIEEDGDLEGEVPTPTEKTDEEVRMPWFSKLKNKCSAAMSHVGSPCMSAIEARSAGSRRTGETRVRSNDVAGSNFSGCGISYCWSGASKYHELYYDSDGPEQPQLSPEGTEAAFQNNVPYTETPRCLSQKFRPRSFSELIGLNVVAQSLLYSSCKGKVAPMYLFHGPPGTGKTSTARIFAAALNCLSLEEQRPCGFCKEWVILFSGRSRDVKELDAALRSSEGASQECISCPLLVALQDSLPRTSITHCQKFHFPKIKVADIVYRLERICIEEGLEFEHDGLYFIAAKSKGSLRDAEIMLDQLSLLGKKITISLVHELVGSVSDDDLIELLDLALSSDTTNTEDASLQLLKSAKVSWEDMHFGTNESNLVADSTDMHAYPATGYTDDWVSMVNPSSNFCHPCNKSNCSERHCRRLKLENIWRSAMGKCRSRSAKSFLRKEGFLSSVHVTEELAIAEVGFSHPDHISRAEKMQSLIESALQNVLGCNVEIRFKLVPRPVRKDAKSKKQPFSLLSCSGRKQELSDSAMTDDNEAVRHGTRETPLKGYSSSGPRIHGLARICSAGGALNKPSNSAIRLSSTSAGARGGARGGPGAADLAAPASGPGGAGGPAAKRHGERPAAADLAPPASRQGRGSPAAPDRAALAADPGGERGAGFEEGRGELGGAGSGRPAADPVGRGAPASRKDGGRPAAMKPGGGKPAAADPVAPAADPVGRGADPAMVAKPSPRKGEEKEKVVLAGGGSPAMEATAAAPATGEKRREGGA